MYGYYTGLEALQQTPGLASVVRTQLGNTTIGAPSGTLDITYVANRWILISVGFRRTGAVVPNVITCTDTAGNTWTDIVAQGSIGNTNSARLAVFKCKPASGATVTLTIGSAVSGSSGTVSVAQFANITDDLTNVAPMGTSTTGDPVAVLPSAPVITNLCYASFYSNGLSVSPTMPAAFTEILLLNPGGARGQTAEGNTINASNAWSSPGTEAVLSIIELKQAPG